MIKVLERNISKQELKDFLYYGLDVNDKQLYQQVNESQANIFQFSGNTASGMIKRAVPQNFDELTSLNALSRPGSSFEFDDFVNNGTDSSKYPEIIAEELKDSHGCILFQEQIMRLVEKLTHGKKSGEKTRKLLKSLGKAKKKQEDLDAWDDLVKVIKEEAKGVLTDREIEDFTQDMLTLSAYSFNKSHAACYTYNACETLYMTRYFKSYFWAASLTYDASKTDALKDSIKNAQKNGFKILPPDVNTSNLHFTPLPDGIRFGLNEIKGVGEEPALNIIENRNYESIIDFIIKTLGTKVNKKITLALVGSGAFDNLIPAGERKKYLKITEEFYEKKKTKKNPEILKELWDQILSLHEWDSKTTAEEYMEMEKTYLSGSFFHGIFSDDVVSKIEKLKSLNKCLRDFNEIREEDRTSAYVPVYISDMKCHQQKNGQTMLFMTCEDCNGEKVSVPMFGSYYQYLKEKMFTGFYLLKVYSNEDGGIIFGSKGWCSNPETIRSMVIRFPKQ